MQTARILKRPLRRARLEHKEDENILLRRYPRSSFGDLKVTNANSLSFFLRPEDIRGILILKGDLASSIDSFVGKFWVHKS